MPIYEEIILGEPLCTKIKQIYFNDMSWSKSCYENVAKKFNLIKKQAREFYKDKDELEMLKELNEFSTEGLKAFGEILND